MAVAVEQRSAAEQMMAVVVAGLPVAAKVEAVEMVAVRAVAAVVAEPE